MGRLRSLTKGEVLIQQNFNQESSLITLEEDCLFETVMSLEKGNSAVVAAQYILNQLEFLKDSIDRELFNPKQILIAYKRAKLSLDLLKHIRKQFKFKKYNTTKELDNRIEVFLMARASFFKKTKPELRKLELAASRYFSKEEERDMKDNIELLNAVLEEISGMDSLLKELIHNICNRLFPYIEEHKNQLSKSELKKSVWVDERYQRENIEGYLCDFGTHSLDLVKNVFRNLPVYYIVDFFRGFTLTVNDDGTITVWCKGRNRFYPEPKLNKSILSRREKITMMQPTMGMGLSSLVPIRKEKEIIKERYGDSLYTEVGDSFLINTSFDELIEIVV